MQEFLYKLFTSLCLDCRQAAKLISESCERDLTFLERMKLAILRRACPYTARYADQVALIHHKAVDIEAAVENCPETPEMTDDCRQRILEEIRRHDG